DKSGQILLAVTLFDPVDKTPPAKLTFPVVVTAPPSAIVNTAVPLSLNIAIGDVEDELSTNNAAFSNVGSVVFNPTYKPTSVEETPKFLARNNPPTLSALSLFVKALPKTAILLLPFSAINLAPILVPVVTPTVDPVKELLDTPFIIPVPVPSA